MGFDENNGGNTVLKLLILFLHEYHEFHDTDITRFYYLKNTDNAGSRKVYI